MALKGPAPRPSGVPAEEVSLPPVAARFCRYARIDTQSDPTSDTVPSTARQLDLSRLLVDELLAMGVRDAALDAGGYVLATLPSTLSPAEAARMPILGLVAHVDTSPDAPGDGVRPTVHPAYDGSPISLPSDPSAVIDPARQPALLEHIGHDLITSDGTTLLGSDDKAGVAVIMQLAEDLLAAEAESAARGDSPARRPALRLLFTPDEEIGRGVDHLELAAFGANAAYTLDGSGVDRLNIETFNAAEAIVTITGVGVHPGYAKGVMVNAARLAAEFVRGLPLTESPETTDGRAGYLHPHHVTATTERAEIRILLRDFELEGMERRQRLVRDLADRIAGAHPGARVDVTIAESYRNMLHYIEETDRRVIDVALAAARGMGFEPALEPVRGGTDGARLSERGIPTPNVFTGGYDFHSRFEWNTVQNLERSLEYAGALVRAWGELGTR